MMAFTEVLEARRRLAGRIETTPLREAPGLSARAGFPVRLKCEHQQTTGSFKLRGATNALLSRRPASKRVFLRAAEIYAENYSDADGRVRASFEIIWLAGWAPHESQQKPLKPGSAQTRLADALKAVREN